MAALAQISINFLALNTPHNALYGKPNFIGLKLHRPICCYSYLSTKKVSRWNKLRAFKEKSSFLTVKRDKNGTLGRGEKRMVFVKFKQGFGFDGIGDGGGGGGKDNSNTVRVVTNLVLAIGLTYLSMTGQLGWVLDAIVSVWLLAVLLPIVGLGAFIWWAGRDIVQGTVSELYSHLHFATSILLFQLPASKLHKCLLVPLRKPRLNPFHISSASFSVFCNLSPSIARNVRIHLPGSNKHEYRHQKHDGSK